MHVGLTRVRTSDQPIGNAAIVAEEMERWLSEIDGFEGFVMLSKEGTTIGLSFWSSRGAAERARPKRLEFIGRIANVADVEIVEQGDYEVSFARLGPLATDGAT